MSAPRLAPLRRRRSVAWRERRTYRRDVRKLERKYIPPEERRAHFDHPRLGPMPVYDWRLDPNVDARA